MKCLSVLLAFLLVLVGCSKTEIRGKEGFWRIEKNNNVWWFVSPEGNREFLTNVTSLHPIQQGRAGDNFVSSDYNGDEDVWAQRTAVRVREFGFSGSGAWSNPAIFPYLPYCKDLNILAHDLPKFEDPRWESEVEKVIIEQVRPNDTNLIGYYTDNELKWDELEKYAAKYFETVHRLLKKHDPNHLILGVRFNHRPPISVIQASKGFVDAHSIHVYDDDAKCPKNFFREIYEISDSPIIVSEFSFISFDNQSGNLNINWPAGGHVSTQAERAEAYKKFVMGLADTSFVIATEWFQWNDEPPSGRSRDGEDCNFGAVDIKDRPYKELAEAVLECRKNVNTAHQKSNPHQESNIWHNDPQRN